MLILRCLEQKCQLHKNNKNASKKRYISFSNKKLYNLKN